MDSQLRRSLGIDCAQRASGGCIHECHRVRIGGDTRFLKLNDARYADAFAAEADGLQALKAIGLRVPEPLGHGVAAGRAYLLLEYLDLGGRADFAALGRMVAEGHKNTGARFGWARDNYIGTTPQANGWSDSWGEFWRERRLRPQIELARRNGFDLALPPLKILEKHQPRPSLLHGDLWSGNAGFTADGPAVFDPAVYYGDREADIAMTELFGEFAPEFYEAYGSVWPLDSGYRERRHAYNLYHLLNHLNLFGGGYLAQVRATLRLLLGA